MIKDVDFYLLNAFFKAIHSVTFYCPTVPDTEGGGWVWVGNSIQKHFP